MTKTTTLLACLLLAGTLTALPAAEASHTTTIAGTSGTPVVADCAGDGSGESMGVEGGTMFFPHQGCSASYNPADAGIPASSALSAVRVRYYVTGHEGTICGFFAFSGRIVGQSPEVCVPHTSPDVDVAVTLSAGAAGSAVVLTWVPTSASYANAYLRSFDVQETHAPPVGPCTPLGLVGTVLSIVEAIVRELLHKPIDHAIYCDLGALGIRE